MLTSASAQALDLGIDWDLDWKKYWPFKGKPPPTVQIDDPYIDIRTGPGRGYPIFYTADKGDWISVHKRKTDWYKVSTDNGTIGWVHIRQLERTLEPTGEKVKVDNGTRDSFYNRNVEVGFMGGELEAEPLIALTGTWMFTRNLGIELAAMESLGPEVHILMGNVSVLAHPFPKARFSPFLALGAGRAELDVAPEFPAFQNADHETVHVGTGFKVYLWRSFMFRLDYRSHVLLTDRNENEEMEEWKAGFSAFW